MIYCNKNFLIAGVSVSGLSSARLLIEKGANVFLYDEHPNICIEMLKNEGAVDVSCWPCAEIIKDIYCIIKSPGVPPENALIELAEQKRIPVISEIELGWYNYKGISLAVTGTNGKSTVTSLIDYILKSDGKESFLCGNIGIPYTNFWNKSHDSFCCVEISSFQLLNCYEFKPHIGAVLNISEDHLNIHHTMEEYIDVKKRIFQNQKFTEYTVLNFDCLLTRQLFEQTASTVCWFSGKQRVKGAYLEGGILKFCGEDIIKANELSLIGYHNVLNCLAAICFTKLIGVDNGVINKALKTFKAIPHRLQFVDKAVDISFYNDSKATNADSALMGAKAMDKSTILLLGGSDKNADFESFFCEIKDLENIRYCVLFGEVREKLVAAAKSVGYGQYFVCRNLEESVYKAYSICPKNGVVLLSPACASFDEFKNYEERGNRFMGIVREICNAVK